MNLFRNVKKIKCPCCGEELVIELEVETYLSEIYVRSVKDHIDSKREALKTILLLDDAELERKIKEGTIPRGIWENVVGRGIEQKVY